MTRYPGVKGAARVQMISAALRSCGLEIVQAPDPSIAPFEYAVRSPDGEAIELICYAFTANEYRQKGRPAGEHRFQIKYGSQFDRPHRLFVSRSRNRITLVFGVHFEQNLFIAIDPLIHETTWFSSSVEFKRVELDTALRNGWHGWERERAKGRRQVDPREDLRIETIFGFTPFNWLFVE